MLKIFMPMLIIIVLYRNFNEANFQRLPLNERVLGQSVAPNPPQVMTEQQIEHEMSFSAIDGSRPFNHQLMRPSARSYTKIKGGWIDIEQLTSR